MARRNGIMSMISTNPILAETWRPEALVEAQQQIAEQVQSSAEIQLPLSSIHLSFSFTPTQTPLRYHYDTEQIAVWAEADIKTNGILSPLWVRPLPGSEDTGEPAYELIAGMRRYLAAKHLKLATVPVKVFNWNDAQAYQAGASENLNSKGFTLLEELDHILHFLSHSLGLAIEEVPTLLYKMANAAKGNTDPAFLESETAQAVQQVFAALGQISWRTFVEHRLRLRKQPPDILAAIREGNISYPKAMAIAKLKDESVRLELLNQAQSLTLETIAERVNQIKQASAVDASQADPNLPAFGTETEREPEPHQAAKHLLKQISSKRSPIWQDPSRAKKLKQYLEKIRLLIEEATAEQSTDSEP